MSRPPILCMGPGADAAKNQANAINQLGGQAIQVTGSIDPSLLTDGPSYGGVLWWGDAKIAQAIDAALAKRTGAILPLITGQPDVGHAHEERHICIDTTASGGNATLLGEVS